MKQSFSTSSHTKKFQISDELIDLLNELCETKLKLYQRLPKSRKDKITEYQYLIEFLDQQIIPLWPKGLMNRQTLSLVINNFPNSNTVENNSNNSTDPEVIDLCDDSSDDGQLSDDNVSNSGQQDNTSEVNDLHESVTNLVTGNCTVNEQQSDENQNINEQSNNMNKDEQLINDKTNSSNDMDSNSNANQTDYITDIMNESYDETLIELNDELSNDNLVVNESNLTKIWKSFSKLCTKMGHISCVYCFAFDRTGKYAFTASDDFLIKIWSTNDGRLISTLRGHVYEITDIAVNYENTLLASGDINYLIFIWCLKSAQSLYVLKGHTQQITSLKFCPLSQIIESRYLMSTGDDGRICFWKYNTMTKVFKTEPDSQLIEQHFKRSGIACSSFSSGGHLLAVGSTDFYVTIFKVDAIKGPKKLTSMKYHSAHVDRIYFSHNSLSFATSSRNVWIEKNIDKDNAFIWRFEKNSWRVIPIKVYTELNGKHIYKRLVVEMQWSQDDQYIITSLTDFSIKVWNSNDGQLVHTLRQHTDEVHVIQSHPIYSHVFLSAGYDSKAVIWNLKKGRLIKSFTGEKGRAILDAAFTADGTMFGVTTCYGQLSLFGLNSQNSYKDIPDELFFHNDYHPIKQLANKLSFIDEETQLDPHLLPIPFLVNINGNQYLPQFQRLVPGREQTKAHQNEPFICKINGNKKVLGLVLNPLSPNKSMNRKKKTNIENKVNDLIEILDFMTRSQMFDSVFGNYINIMSTKSSKEFQDFIDRLLLAINQDLNTADYYTKSNELIRYPPSELIIPILNHCLPFFVPETSDKILSDSISMKTKFKILKGLDKNDETDELSIPNDPSILSLDSFQPKSTFFSNTLIESSDDSISFSDNLKECFKCLYVTLLLASIQPKEINIKVVSLIKGLMDETVKTDQFIEQITQILDMNITIDNYSLHLKEILPELKYYLNKDLLYLNGINNVPLFAPKGLAVSVANHLEHDYCNGRFEESVDKRTLYLRDLTANPTSFREKGWKVAETQLRQRPGHWLSFDFNATWDQLWSQRDAVIQLNKEQIEEINNELKQKEIKEIEFLKEFLDNNEQQNNSNELVPELSNSQLNDTLDNQIINNEIDMNGSSPQSPTSSEESKTKGQKLDLWIQKYEVPTVSQSTRSKTKATKSSGRRQLPQTPANSTRSKHNLEEFYDEMSSNSKLNYTQIRTYSRLTNLTKSNSLIQSVSNNNNNNIMDSEPMSPESDLMDMDSETETDNGQSDDDSEPAAKKSRLENKSTDLANDNQLNAENNVELSVSETQSKSVEEQNHSRSDQLDLIISTFNNFVDKMANKESNESSEKVLMSTTTPIITESTETTITLTAKDVEKTLNLENLEQTVSKTIDIIESQYKTIITKQVVCDIETQTENIDIKPVIKSESIDMKVKKEFFYLCIFCRQLITFFHRKEAFDHLKSHLAAVIRCDICSVNFANMKAFRTHNKQHSISEKNVVNIRNFCLSIDWIESFLNFQMTDTFKKLIRRYDGFCPVCQSLKLCNYQPLINDKANNGHTIQQHIRLHLNCDKVFECKTCLKSSSDTKKYFFGTTDAHSHVLTEHRIKLDTDTSLATHYNKVETLSPNLDEHIKFCIDINNSIDDLYEINSID